MNRFLSCLYLIASLPLFGSVIVYDGLETHLSGTGVYLDGASVHGQGFGTGWDTAGWNATTATKYVTSVSGLNYTDGFRELDTTDGGLTIGVGSGYQPLSRGFQASTSGDDYYFAFLVQRTGGAPHTNWRISLRNSTNERVSLTDAGDGNITLKVSFIGGYMLTDTSVIPWDQVNLVVGRVTAAASGGSGAVEVWINPHDLSDVEYGGNDAYLLVSNNGSGSISHVDNLFLSNTGAQTGVVDEITVSYGSGAGFQDVIPFNPISGAEPSLVEDDFFATSDGTGNYVVGTNVNGQSYGFGWNSAGWDAGSATKYTIHEDGLLYNDGTYQVEHAYGGLALGTGNGFEGLSRGLEASTSGTVVYFCLACGTNRG